MRVRASSPGARNPLTVGCNIRFPFGVPCAEDLFYGTEPNFAEYEELRAVDEWVETMADLSLQEESHLIDLALVHADSLEVEAIQARAQADQNQQLYYQQQQQQHPYYYYYPHHPQVNLG